jgi:hypothetical protein
MKTTQIKLRYFYAFLPFIFGIVLCISRLMGLFGDLAKQEQTGSEKASMLAEGISNNLWFPIIGLVSTAVCLFLVKQNRKKRNLEGRAEI